MPLCAARVSPHVRGLDPQGRRAAQGRVERRGQGGVREEEVALQRDRHLRREAGRGPEAGG